MRPGPGIPRGPLPPHPASRGRTLCPHGCRGRDRGPRAFAENGARGDGWLWVSIPPRRSCGGRTAPRLVPLRGEGRVSLPRSTGSLWTALGHPLCPRFKPNLCPALPGGHQPVSILRASFCLRGVAQTCPQLSVMDGVCGRRKSSRLAGHDHHQQQRVYFLVTNVFRGWPLVAF